MVDQYLQVASLLRSQSMRGKRRTLYAEPNGVVQLKCERAAEAVVEAWVEADLAADGAVLVGQRCSGRLQVVVQKDTNLVANILLRQHDTPVIETPNDVGASVDVDFE
jgi:hypothetical protein